MSIITTNITTPDIGVATATYTSTTSSAVTLMSLCNYNTDAVACDIHIVSLGSPLTADNTNLMVSELVIPADDTYILYQGSEKIIMDVGDHIVVKLSVTAPVTTAALTVITSYVEV